jgi:hypothetical protein
MTSSTKAHASERQLIRDAMDRLLNGLPLFSDGKLTVKALAEEAQVKRWLLTHRHLDLQDEFRARVDQQGGLPRAVQVLSDEIKELKERSANQAAEMRRERETVKRLERVVNVLMLQLDEERRTESRQAPVYPLRRGKHNGSQEPRKVT